MSVVRRLLAMVAMLVAGVAFVLTPGSAAAESTDAMPVGLVPIDEIPEDAAVIKIPRLVKDSPSEVGTNEYPVVSQRFCNTQNVFDQTCIQALSQNGVAWTGIRGSYELGLSRPATACFGFNVALVTNRGEIPAASGQSCFGRPLVREWLNLPLFGGYCAVAGFQDQQLGHVFGTTFLCFN